MPDKFGGISMQEATRGVRRLVQAIAAAGVPGAQPAAAAALAEEQAIGWLRAFCTPEQAATIEAACSGVEIVAIKHCVSQVAVILTKAGVSADDMPHAVTVTGRLVSESGSSDPLGAAEFVATTMAVANLHDVNIYGVLQIARAAHRL